MRVLVFSAVLLCSTLSATSATAVSCRWNDTLIPNPDDCGSFYQCDNGVPKLSACPPGLHFNPVQLVCDRPESANCSATSTTSTTVQPTSTSEGTTATQGTTTTQGTTASQGTTTTQGTTVTQGTTTTQSTTTTQGTTTSQSTTTTQGTTTTNATTSRPTTTELPTTSDDSNPCPSRGWAMVPKPDSCTQYYVCNGGSFIMLDCPAGMQFNAETTKCDWLANVNCGVDETTSTTVSTTTENPKPCPPNGTAILPNPDSCSSYLVCINGDSLAMECPKGMEFNKDTGKCDLAENVKCGEEETTTESDAGETTTESDAGETTTAEAQTDETTIDAETEEPTTVGIETTSAAPNPCPQNGSALLPYADSCTKYYVCIKGDYIVLDCPKGMQFNAANSSCDDAANVQCVVQETEKPTEEPTEEPSEESTEEPTENTTDVPTEDSTAEYTTVATEEPTTVKDPNPCPPKGSLILADPDSCSNFIVCINGGHITMECPNGTLFDEFQFNCEYADNVTCGNNETTDEPESTTTENEPTTSDDVEETTTGKPSNEPQCPEEGYAMLPNPDDCSSFIICVNGMSAVINCPEGLDFNVKNGTCDTPANANCRPISTTSAPTTLNPYVPPCPANGTVLLPDPKNCSAYYVCINGLYANIPCSGGYQFSSNKSECVSPAESDCNTWEFYEATAFLCEKDGSYPNPEDCGSYYVCSGNQAFLMECPGDLIFDSHLLTCNSPDMVSCSITSGTSTSSTTSGSTSSSTGPTPSSSTQGPTSSSTGLPDIQCPSNGTEILGNPNDCTSFFVCIEGDYGVVQCPPGYGYNPALHNCDKAEIVNCDGGSTGGPPQFQPDCPSQGVAQLPNPNDCNSYFFCINGQFALITCPTGFNFNTATGQCDSSASCPSDSTSALPPTSSPTTSTASSATPTVTTEPTTVPTEGTTSGTTAKPVECKENGQLLPNPSDCSTFFICDNGSPVMQTCPPGLEWNAQASVCDSPSTANCKASKKGFSLFSFLKIFN